MQSNEQLSSHALRQEISTDIKIVAEAAIWVDSVEVHRCGGISRGEER